MLTSSHEPLTTCCYVQYSMNTIKHHIAVPLPNAFSDDCIVHGYTDEQNKEHLALVIGDLDQAMNNNTPVLVRLHSSCATGDIFHSSRCDCCFQLHTALDAIAKEGVGILIYVDQEGRGIGLINKLKAYKLQDEGMDTVEANEALGFAADDRDLSVGPAILQDLGVSTIRLMTNNPQKVAAMEAKGITVSERVPIIHDNQNAYLKKYLGAKKEKLGHLFE